MDCDTVKNQIIIYGKIVGFDENKVSIKCLIDEENLLFQLRIFDKEPFPTRLLEFGNIIRISIITGDGWRTFKYELADNSDVDRLSPHFKIKKYLSDELLNSAFFTELSPIIDED